MIKDEGIALFELVKNSYDADATKVDIKLNYIHLKNTGEITIKDNGTGMDFPLVVNHWLEPGTDYKEKQINILQKSPLFGRLPLGEKGIGRFGSHKLGKIINITTKKDFEEEVEININWSDFDESKYLDETPINIQKNQKPKVFKKSIERIPINKFNEILEKTDNNEKALLSTFYTLNNDYAELNKKLKNVEYIKLKHILIKSEYSTSGTLITIKELWHEWSRGMLRNTFRSVNSINSPFPNNKSEFKINIETDKNDWLDSLMTPEKAIKHALFIAKGHIEADELYMNYEFIPWKEMEELDKRESSKIEILESKEEVYDENKKKYVNKTIPFTLEDHKLGRIDFEFYMYDRDNKTMGMGSFDKVGLTKLLNNSGGVRVYRDNMRVYDYGEPGTDWLNLDYQRFQTPGQAISNNQLLGAIYLNRDSSSDLLEKTNREGFIVNPAFEVFIKAISLAVKKAAQERNIDKEYIRDHYGVTAKSEPVINKVESLKEYVTLNVTTVPIRNKINEKLEEIEKEYKNINEKIVTAAGSGLALNIAVHEMEKIIDEMIRIVKEEEIDSTINTHVDRLHSTLKQYAQLAHYSKDTNLSIKKTIQKAIDLNLYRLYAHDVEIENTLENTTEDIKVDFPEKLLLSSISNLIDNSIHWLEKKFTREQKANKDFKKKIYIKLTKDISGGPAIIMADNGDGFSAGTDQLVKAFVGYKDNGMGLGLYIIDQSMNINNGKLIFPETGDTSIPKEYNGAVIGLQFFKEGTK
ncbi:MAG: ATP-binding protein [Halarcobacter ebronensis]